MNLKLSIYHWLFLLPFIVLYNNCGGFKKIDTQKVLGSSTCQISAKVSLKLAQFSINECDKLSDIVCEKRLFNPEVLSGDYLVKECISSSTLGEHCFDLMVRQYDTSQADGEPEEFALGGSYNYQEINCYNKKWTHNNVAIFTSSAQSSVAAVEQLYKKCIEGGNL
jgi:hypothetical protein